MYLISERCMNAAAKVECLECGGCGREFADGHIVGEKSCGTCKHYYAGLSECKLIASVWSITHHMHAFRRKSNTCERWEDAQ